MGPHLEELVNEGITVGELATIQAALVVASLSLQEVRWRLHNKPWVINQLAEEVVTDLLDAQAYEEAVNFSSTMEKELAHAIQTRDPNANDYLKVQCVGGEKLVDEFKEIKSVSIK